VALCGAKLTPQCATATAATFSMLLPGSRSQAKSIAFEARHLALDDVLWVLGADRASCDEACVKWEESFEKPSAESKWGCIEGRWPSELGGWEHPKANNLRDLIGMMYEPPDRKLFRPADVLPTWYPIVFSKNKWVCIAPPQDTCPKPNCSAVPNGTGQYAIMPLQRICPCGYRPKASTEAKVAGTGAEKATQEELPTTMTNTTTSKIYISIPGALVGLLVLLSGALCTVVGLWRQRSVAKAAAAQQADGMPLLQSVLKASQAACAQGDSGAEATPHWSADLREV